MILKYKKKKRKKLVDVVAKIINVSVPSIVVHNGNRSQSRPVSPTGPSSAEMPALPTAKNALVSGDSSYSTAGDQDMIDSNVNVTIENLSSGNTINRPTSLPVPSCQASPPDKIDSESNNFRNRVRNPLSIPRISVNF